MEPLLKVDLATATAYLFTSMNGARIYVPGRFMPNVKQQVEDIAIDLITSVLNHSRQKSRPGFNFCLDDRSRWLDFPGGQDTKGT